MPSDGPGREARHVVVERNLVRRAFEYLTVDAFLSLPFESLGPTKALLKRYFSLEPWGPAEDEALTLAVGPGEGSWQRPLDDDVVLAYGWDDGRFSVRVLTTAVAETAAAASSGPEPSLAASFDGPVIPEATPNPRTIRFRTGPIHDGPSRWYESAAKADDPRARRVFDEFDEVANLLVGPDFVGVSLHRGADWERLLAPVLQVVTDEFAPGGAGGAAETWEDTGERVIGGPAGAGAQGARAGAGGGRSTRLEQAWQELGSLRPADPADLAAVLQAVRHADPFRRQVAANLLREADHDAAAAEWGRLVKDPSRAVRRAVVDAMVDVGRERLRPLLETALRDNDPWVRWKALRGLVELGPRPSREAIGACADDPDFRVRLEVTAALRASGSGDDAGVAAREQ